MRHGSDDEIPDLGRHTAVEDIAHVCVDGFLFQVQENPDQRSLDQRGAGLEIREPPRRLQFLGR